jgi:hypothetical protein
MLSATSEAKEAVVGNSALKSGGLRRVAHRRIRIHYEDTFHLFFLAVLGHSFSCNPI